MIMGCRAPYWPVSCYRCVIPSCRSPTGLQQQCSSAPHSSLNIPRSSGDDGAEHQPNRLKPPGHPLFDGTLIYNCHTSLATINTTKEKCFSSFLPLISLWLEFLDSRIVGLVRRISSWWMKDKLAVILWSVASDWSFSSYSNINPIVCCLNRFDIENPGDLVANIMLNSTCLLRKQQWSFTASLSHGNCRPW